MTRHSLHRLVRTHLAAAVVVLGVPLLALWSWLTLGTTLLAGLDRAGDRLEVSPDGNAAQVWSAISIVTVPSVVAVAMVVVSVWAWRRRLRNLAWALVIASALSWGGNHLFKMAIRRARPSSALDHLITYQGSSYPSGHVAMTTAAAAMVIATTTTTRQSKDVRVFWRVVGVLGVLTVAADRLTTGAHWATDVVGGFLVGIISACLACWVCRVHMLPVPVRIHHDERRRTAAVIWNPSKVLDVNSFRRTIDWELAARGWADALWLQTRPDDPGHEMCRQAIAAGVDLVLVAGGDGTVRVACSELANTNIPVAVIPTGTGNLLARNLGIPLDTTAAAELAFVGKPRPTDLVKVTMDDDPATTEHFAVMAGIGFDAQVMEATRPELKRTVGSAAYFLAAAGQMGTPAMDLTFRLDDGPAQKRRAKVALVGNVGLLQGGIELFPLASASDGLLEVVIASPTGMGDIATMAAKLFTPARVRGEVAHVDELRGRKVRFEVGDPTPCELDGDMASRCRVFEAEVAPGALQLVLPR